MNEPEQQPTARNDRTSNPEPVEELKFVGYKQPRDSGMWVFVKNHKFHTALGLVFFIVVSSVVGIFAVSRPQNPAVVNTTSKPTLSQSSKGSEATAPALEDPGMNIAGRESSIRTSDKYFELVAKSGDVWLTRSDLSWDETVRWKEWLFFGAKRGDRIGVEAFSFNTRSYVAIADLPAGDLIDARLTMRVDNEFLYIELNGASGSGSTHRCMLNEQKACSEFQLVYGQGGSVRLLTPETGIVVVQSNEESPGAVTVKKLVIQTGVATDIARLQATGSTRQVVAAVAADELVWLADVENGLVTQLQAVNFSGERSFLVPAQTFPIVGAKLVPSSLYSYTTIELHNDTQVVTFDVRTKQFGAPKAYVAAPVASTETTDIQKIISISARLELPDDFVLRNTRE